MPIHFLASVVSQSLSWDAYGPVAAGLVSMVCLKRWAAGNMLLDKMDDAVDLHGRVLLVTGGLTTFGVTVLSNLCNRGAHVVVLVPASEMVTDQTQQLIQLLRDSTRNSSIFAEGCDILSADSVTRFCKTWNGGAPPAPGAKPSPRRLDGVVFLPLDALHGTAEPCTYEKRAQMEMAGRTLLLSELLPEVIRSTPPERQVRIVSTISPWYAAGVDVLEQQLTAVGTASKDGNTLRKSGLSIERFRADGAASLHWLVITTAFQRRLDTAALLDKRPRHSLLEQFGTTDQDGDATALPRRSNVNLVNVCVGFERNRDVLGYVLPTAVPQVMEQHGRSTVGDRVGAVLSAEIILRYLLAAALYPLIWLLSKSPGAATDAAVWAVVAPLERQGNSAVPVPTPGERDQATAEKGRRALGILPGELYREGKVIAVPLPPSIANLSEGVTPAPALVSIPSLKLEALLKSEEAKVKTLKATKRE